MATIKGWSTRDWWAPQPPETLKKCPKYGIFVSQCSKFFECEDCTGKKQIKPVKDTKTKRRYKHTKTEKSPEKTSKKRFKQGKKTNKPHKLGGKNVRVGVKRTFTKKWNMDSRGFGSLFGHKPHAVDAKVD